MSNKEFDIEYVAKAQMAARLNLLMTIEPSFVLQLIATYHVVNNEVGKTNFVTEAPNADNPEALLNLMGILNGVVGQNKWVLSLDHSGDSPCFKVSEVKPSTYLPYKVHKPKPYKAITKDGENSES